MSQYLMTIDAGTGSGRAVIFDLEGQQKAISQQEWTHHSEDGVPNSMNFDWDANWKLICECVQDAMAQLNASGDEILAVTASSMREGIVLYDADGKELWAVANVDARADKQVSELKNSFADIEQDFYEQSGQTFALGALPRVMWLKQNHPEVYEKSASISMISDWVLAKLSNVIATDPSNGGTTGIFDLEKRDWASAMADKVGIKADIFPPVLEPGEVLGPVSESAAAQTGLSTNTKVTMGGGDVQLGAAGLGLVNPGDVAILGGSFWQQVVNIDCKVAPPKNMEIRVNPHVIPGQSQAEGITFFSGLVMRWFRDAFCDMEKQQAAEQDVDAYTLLEQKAQNVPVGSHGIMPIFSDDMKYGKWYHAAPSFINLSIDPEVCNRASMFRALQENACLVSAINLDKIAKFSGIKFDSIIFAAGAAKGFLWPQILADVTGKTVKIPKVIEATALGGAMAAGVGAGVYSSLADAAAELVQWDRTYEPNMDNFEQYQQIKTKWQAVYQKQLELVDAGLTTSMWQAPGL